MGIELERNLDIDEFTAAKEAYEKVVCKHWIPTDGIEQQELWIAAFEQAKKKYLTSNFVVNSTIK